MKKAVIILCLAIVVSGLCACGKSTKSQKVVTPPAGQSAPETETEETEKKETEKKELDPETEAHNRSLLAEALLVEEDDDDLKYHLNMLNKLDAGKLQSVEYKWVDPDDVLEVIAEDGTTYWMYLSGGFYVEAVKNLDTGEWPFKSYK